MFHRWTPTLSAFGSSLVKGPSRLHQAIRQSLNPANDREARILEAQLELVRKNVRVLDYVLPLAGLILVSTKTFPQNRGFPSAITASLVTVLSDTAKIQSGQVLFLTRA